MQEPYGKLQKVNTAAFNAQVAIASMKSCLYGEAAASEDQADQGQQS